MFDLAEERRADVNGRNRARPSILAKSIQSNTPLSRFLKSERMSSINAYAFISPDNSAFLQVPSLLSNRGLSPGTETAAIAVAISTMLKTSGLNH